MYFRGIRGATTAEKNSTDSILLATKELLEKIISINNIQVEDIASIFFSVTNDLNSAFPAKAARDLGMTNTPLLCLNEIEVPGGLKHCIRILMHVNTDKKQTEIKHVYLKDAVQLRPELALPNE